MSAAEKIAADRQLVVERTFDAPVELVWKAFTDPKHLDQWWGPNGFRNETHAMKLEVGGSWRYTMHGPDGKDWPNWIRFEEIVPQRKLAYAHGGEGDEPHFHATTTFEPKGKKTRVEMRLTFPSAEVLKETVMRAGAIEGGRQTLARLAGHLPHFEVTDSIVLSRLYGHPRKDVFAAWSTAKALSAWWGPKGMTTDVPELEFKVGGRYRMVMKDGKNEYPFHGKFVEIVPNERIVFDATIEGLNEQVLTTVTFADDAEGFTLLTVKQTRPKDAMAAKGQLEGWSGQLEKLEQLLASSAR